MFRKLKIKLRGLIWRLSRKVYMLVRKENFNGAILNGEFWLIRHVTNNLDGEKKALFIDIGAFKGEWSIYASNFLNKKKIIAQILAFEASKTTFKNLKKNIKNYKNINLFNLAFSNTKELKNFYIFGNMNGTNSLIPNKSASIEKVNTINIDNFIIQNKIKHIDFIKSDTEGHDFKIIMGAKNAFDKELIDFWQFEYNHRWIDDRSFLKDVFFFFEGTNYKIGKLCKDRIEILNNWDIELERFFEANFVILNKRLLNNSFCINVNFNKFNVINHE